jgi:hypothetical protein
MVQNEIKERTKTLRTTITDEIILAMGASPQGLAGKALTPLLHLATHRFAQLIAAFDLDVGRIGTHRAARNLLQHLVQGCKQSGAASIPGTGPLLIASNHPGGMDSISILAALPRTDVQFIISDVPFLRALRHCREHAVYASEDTHERLGAVRQMIRHLGSGGTVIIFPGTELDPDPSFLPGAAERLKDWSRSIALLLRRVPETQLVPTIVGGVLSPRFHAHPLTKLAPVGWERIKLAEMLQIMQQLVLGTRLDLWPTVTFGEPVRLKGLIASDTTTSHDAVMSAILRRAQDVLDQHQAGQRLARAIPLPD